MRPAPGGSRLRVSLGQARCSHLNLATHGHLVRCHTWLATSEAWGNLGLGSWRQREAAAPRGEGSKPFLKLNWIHYSKLKALYERNCPASGADDADAWTQQFHDRVWCLLARYEALQGHGYQAALGGRVFDALLRRLDVSFECFASPLNCRYERFCSAFADTDGPFGSAGSFFDFSPANGSFEANPPFVPEFMLAFAKRAAHLLEAATGPLSFTVVVPTWEQIPAWQELTQSPWRRGQVLTFEAEDHVYCDGAQVRRHPHSLTNQTQ